MSTKPTRRKRQSPSVKKRRQYDSPLRRQQTAETRDKIIAAGSEIVHGLPTWDWRSLTFRAVSERAGVSVRTVHRHFNNERDLRDAILQHLVKESGVSLDTFELADLGAISARIFIYLSSFAAAPAKQDDPAFAAMDEYRRDALFNAVVRATPTWNTADQEMAGAILDVLWNVPTYERLITAWHFDTKRTAQAISWVIDLVVDAIKRDRRLGSSR